MASFPIRTLPTLGGLVIWALHFGIIYGFTGLACARGWSSGPFGVSAITAFTTGATIVALAALAGLVLAARRSHPASGEVGFDNPGRDRDPATGHFMRVIGAYAAAYAAVAVLFTTLPVYMTDLCL